LSQSSGEPSEHGGNAIPANLHQDLSAFRRPRRNPDDCGKFFLEGLECPQKNQDAHLVFRLLSVLESHVPGWKETGGKPPIKKAPLFFFQDGFFPRFLGDSVQDVWGFLNRV